MSVYQLGNNPGQPGQTAVRTNVEKSPLAFFYSPPRMAEVPLIKSTSTDAGSTPTSTLRPGLLMAQLDADGQWVPYDPTAIGTGAQEARGVLISEVNMLDYSTAAGAQRYVAKIAVGGDVCMRANSVINLDAAARQSLKNRGWTFDDEDVNPSTPSPFRTTKEVTADTTVTAAMNGALFIVNGSAQVTMTLPTAANGLTYQFLNVANQTMVIASGSANIIADGNAGVTSITYSTASHKIGSLTTLTCRYVNGTLKWLCLDGKTTQTLA